MDDTPETERDRFDSSPPKSKEKQLGSDIGDPVEGEKECKKCNKTFKTTGSYQKHTDARHRDNFPYVCKVCDKGFVSKSGYRMHKLTHRSEEQRQQTAKETISKSDKEVTYVCKNDEHRKPVFFSSKRAFKTHMKHHTHPVRFD